MRANRLREIWTGGKPATNAWLALPSSLSAEMLAHQGWHSLTIDMQHGAVDYAAMLAMLTTISTTDTVPLVRVPWNMPGDVMRALDAGAYGVICPNVDTAEDAVRFVSACRYAPAGGRSVGPMRAALYAGADYMAHANDTVLAIVQIESALALKNVDAIAAVPGLDMLYIGPSDLGLSLGREAKPDQVDPVVVEAIDAILAAAKRAKRRAGIFCVTVSYAKAMIEKGFDLVTVTSDTGLLAGGARLAKEFA
jgi:4-hydroxy-2-oxoheptanedioate aldolase